MYRNRSRKNPCRWRKSPYHLKMSRSRWKMNLCRSKMNPYHWKTSLFHSKMSLCRWRRSHCRS